MHDKSHITVLYLWRQINFVQWNSYVFRKIYWWCWEFFSLYCCLPVQSWRVLNLLTITLTDSGQAVVITSMAIDDIATASIEVLVDSIGVLVDSIVTVLEEDFFMDRLTWENFMKNWVIHKKNIYRKNICCVTGNNILY